MGAIDCRPVEECSRGGGATGIPSPPKSPLLSPEVISEATTTSPEDKGASPADEAVGCILYHPRQLFFL